MMRQAALRTTILVLALLAAPCAFALDQPPGQRIQVEKDALPPPGASPSVTNPPVTIARPEGALPRVPEGFEANLFADGLGHARWLLVAENGDVFLAESQAGKITLLRDSDGDGRADLVKTFAEGFARPHGMAIHDGYFYLADTERVWRTPYRPGQEELGEAEPITPPGALGDSSGHWTRNLAFHPSEPKFYVAVGSRGNINIEPEPRATIQEFALDGSQQRTFASGLRNPVGIEFYPGSSQLWAVVNERDGMGDALVPDYLASINEGEFFGWPYWYIGDHPQPDFAERAPEELRERLTEPELLFRSHSAALGLTFYTGTAFPEEYRGDAFVGLHGSWNADDPVGYMVARVRFEDGRPVENAYEIFASGFWAEGQDRAQVWGRPVGVAVAADGALLVADDAGQAIWRISYWGQ